MRRILIVTSSYQPTMIADMHRARHLAWDIPKLGWDVTILSPGTEFQQSSCLDDDSAAFFAPDVAYHAVKESGAWLFRLIGSRTVGFRALLPLAWAGAKLIRKEKFDIVYITTAQFPLFLLGAVWRKLLGVPYVLDFHDPIHINKEQAEWLKPGLKRRLSQWLARRFESTAVMSASGLVAVSPDYLSSLESRYAAENPAWALPGRMAAIPFALRTDDIREKRAGSGARAGKARIVYIGAGSWVMERAFSLVCRALAALHKRDPDLVNAISIEFYGTRLGWQPGDRMELQEIADSQGLNDIVKEDPRRVSYARSIDLLASADGLLILGVNDLGYMPSKLAMCAYFEKPMLASVRRGGVMHQQFLALPDLGKVLSFERSGEEEIENSVAVLAEYLKDVVARRTISRKTSLQPFLSVAMAERHVVLFESCLTAPV